MRLKIILGNLIIVLAVGLVAFWMVRSQLETALSEQVDERIENDGVLMDRSWRLSAAQFLEQVDQRAKTENVTVVFGALDEESRRQRAHRAANAISRWFMDPARGRQGGPDVVAITDASGRVIARDKDVNRMHGQRLGQALPTVREAIRRGTPKHDAWWFEGENKLLQTGIAPVEDRSGTVVGSLVVGYELSNGLARREADVLGREVAFLYDGSVYSASVSREAAGGLQNTLSEGVLRGESSGSWTVDGADGRSFVGVTAPLPLSPSAQVAYGVMADRSDQLALMDTTTAILLLMALGVLGVFIYGWAIGGSFMRPLERIEDDVLRVINGRTDLRIDVDSAEFGGLAYRINQLINVFTGVAEEDEQGRVSRAPPHEQEGGAAWQGAAFAEGGRGAGAGDDVIDDPAVASELESEPAEAYYDRLHGEYVAAKQSAGEDVSSIPKDRFIKRVQGNERALAQKHGVRMVRFQVGDQGALRPVLIR
ncbi:MAG: MXAN_5187 C-terminal domain-containing protein [Myxococcota bacterium]